MGFRSWGSSLKLKTGAYVADTTPAVLIEMRQAPVQSQKRTHRTPLEVSN